MALETAPLWVCFLPQFASVVGDSFGQRCCRVYHKMSRRRFLLAMCLVSCLQMFVVLTIFQLATPTMTTVIYEVQNGTTVDYCKTAEGRNSTDCYAQGPLTIYKALGACPILLVNGLVNLAYYLGEAALYKQSLGVLMLVLSALSSSFIIAPLQEAAGLPGGSAVPAGVLVLGICGALVCVAERTPKEAAALLSEEEQGDDFSGQRDTDSTAGASPTSLVLQNQASPAIATGVHRGSGNTEESPLNGESADAACAPTSSFTNESVEERKPMKFLKAILGHLPLLLPFSVLAVVYAVYFVLMLFYNDHCKQNAWGYNSVDQVLLPLYLFAMFLGIAVLPEPIRNAITANEDKHETFVQALKGMLREMAQDKGAGFFNLFMYRLLINGRALAYSYIAVRYNLSTSYLQLTLIRVVLSWVASLVLVLVFPRFIRAEKVEQIKLKDPLNITLKLVGTVAIVFSLLILHHDV